MSTRAVFGLILVEEILAVELEGFNLGAEAVAEKKVVEVLLETAEVDLVDFFDEFTELEASLSIRFELIFSLSSSL